MIKQRQQQQNYQNMHPGSFHYEQKDENFPQIGAPHRNDNSQIGKILSRYQFRQQNDHSQNNRNKTNSVHAGTALNYSQIYNDLKIQKSSSNNSTPNNQEDYTVSKEMHQNQNREEQYVSNSPYNFHSSVGLGNRMNKKKALPGIIIKTPRQSERNYDEHHSAQSQYRSEYGARGAASVQNNNISFDDIEIGENQQKPNTMMEKNRKFRINDVKDHNNKKINYQEVSDLYISDNQNDEEEKSYHRTPRNAQKVTQSEAVIMNKPQRPQIVKEIGKLTDKSRFNYISHQVNEQYQPIQKEKAKEQKVQKTEKIERNNVQKQTVSLEKHINWDKELQKSQNNTSNLKQEKQNEKNRENQEKQKQRQIQRDKERENQREKQRVQRVREMEKERERTKQLGHSRSIGVGNHRINEEDLLHSFHDESVERAIILDKDSVNMKKNKKEEELVPQQKNKQETQKSQPSAHFNYNPSVNGQEKSKATREQKNDLQKIIVHFPEVDAVEHHPSAYDQSSMRQSKIEGMNNGSRIASTIKAVPEEGENQNEDQNDELGDNLLNDIEIKEFEEKTKQPEEETPQKIPEPEQYVNTFSIQQYMQIYPVLKSIQSALKASLINVQQILRGIKKYLEIIAAGNLDNIDEFNLALHKKKIIKNALFFERVSIIILAFSYVSHTIKDSHKFLLNLIAYSINNSLILIKVLQETQISENSNSIKKSTVILHKRKGTIEENSNLNTVQQKSDRLAMKRNLDTLRNNNDVLVDSIHKLSKSDEVFYDNLKQIVKVINKASLEQTFYNLLEYFAFYLNVSELDNMIPFLAVAPNPYLSPTVGNNSRSSLKYTLVVDILEIFCLGTKKSKTNVFRPYSQHFLHEMSQYYEIVAFTSAFPANIDKVIDMLDPKGYIQHRLYKHHAVNKNKVSLKEVDRIGRDMDQIILLDNENSGGQGSYDNCIHIPVWKGNKNDTILAQLCPLLAMIALKRVRAPEAVKKVRQQSFKNKQNGVKYINFGITLD